MRASLLVTGLLTTLVAAQSPLTTTFASNNGNAVGGMVFFDLSVTDPAGVTIKQLDIHTPSPAGEIDVYVGPASYSGIASSPTSWSLVATGTIVAAGLGNASVACLGPGFYLPPGSYAVAVAGATLSQRYTSGAVGVPLVYANAELTLTAGAASNTTFGGVQFAPRIWNGNIHYLSGQTSSYSCAYTKAFGAGCNEGATSWYESFASLVAFDLAGTVAQPTVLKAIATGATGFAVLPMTPLWSAPVGLPLSDNHAAAPGPIGNDGISEPLLLPFTFAFPGGSTGVVHASANGWLLLGATASNFAQVIPSSDGLLSQMPRLAPLWCNLDPAANVTSNAASGIHYDVDPSGQSVYITWLDVGDARTGPPPTGTTSVNVQCVLHSNGDYEFRYGEVVPGPGTGPVVVGWSQGGLASTLPDPGSVDISATAPLLTNGPDRFALGHTAGVARLGSTLELAVQHVENFGNLGFLMVGDAAHPNGLGLAAVGAPGCFVFTNILATAAVPVSASTGSGAFALLVPNQASLIGATLVSQYGALTVHNSLQVATSNGVIWTIGN